MIISWGLAHVPALNKWNPLGLEITGHSLGGGLAAAGAIAADRHANTFNAAGLAGVRVFTFDHELPRPDLSNEILKGAVARYHASASHVDAYSIWNGSGPRALDTPDILTWLQSNLEVQVGDRFYLPDAVGVRHTLEGLYNFSEAERTAVSRTLLPALGDLLQSAVETGDEDGSWLGTITNLLQGVLSGELEALLFTSIIDGYYLKNRAIGKMVDSHAMTNVLYGLMHGPGWNVYDVPYPNQGGPQ